MGVAFKKGQSLGPNDLKIGIRDTMGNLVDPYVITYSVFDFTTGVEVLMGAPNQIPQSTGVGTFYAAITLALDANIGEWVIRWNFMETPTAEILQVVQEFAVVGDAAVLAVTSSTFESEMVRRLRVMLRDNNPDRNYRFRPPNTERYIQAQTEVFGYIWEDSELLDYVTFAIDDYNAAPPVTGVTLGDLPDRWRTVILMGAAAHAVRAVAMNWIADEFSVRGDEKVKLNCDGEIIEAPIEDLFEALFLAKKEEHHADMLDTLRSFDTEDGISREYSRVPELPTQLLKIYGAFKNGSLKVVSVSTITGEVRETPVVHVVKHHTSDKRMVRITTLTGSSVFTEDHSLFLYKEGLPVEVATKDLLVGDTIAVVREGALVGEDIIGVTIEPNCEFSYDLSVPVDQNFVLSSGILAHNSYSVSGVSLDLDKSSKYMSMKENFEQEFDKLKDQAKQSIKIVKGLKQPRYGVGISSALGPFSRTGVQSRRNYVDSGGGYWT